MKFMNDGTFWKPKYLSIYYLIKIKGCLTKIYDTNSFAGT